MECEMGLKVTKGCSCLISKECCWAGFLAGKYALRSARSSTSCTNLSQREFEKEIFIFRLHLTKGNRRIHCTIGNAGFFAVYCQFILSYVPVSHPWNPFSSHGHCWTHRKSLSAWRKFMCCWVSSVTALSPGNTCHVAPGMQLQTRLDCQWTSFRDKSSYVLMMKTEVECNSSRFFGYPAISSVFYLIV